VVATIISPPKGSLRDAVHQAAVPDQIRPTGDLKVLAK
jgi:hypothetical protein